MQGMNGSCPVSMGAPGAPNDRGCAYRTVPVCRRKWLSSSSPAENAVFRSEPLDEQVKQHSPCGCGFFAVRKSFNRESLELAVWHVRQPCSAALRAMNRIRRLLLQHFPLPLCIGCGPPTVGEAWQCGLLIRCALLPTSASQFFPRALNLSDDLACL